MRYVFSVAVLCAVVLAGAWGGLPPASDLEPIPASQLAFQNGTTRMLTVAVDAEGVRVLLGTNKPGLRYRRHRMADSMPFRWELRDASGRSIADGGFDPGRLDLDPAHAGGQGRLEGDHLVPTRTCINIKVPAVAFDHIEFGMRRRGQLIPFGSVRSEDVTWR